MREVGEETGLRDVKLEGPLLVTYHTYDENGKHILKETHWFRMTAADDRSLKPQQEEQITELRWVSAGEMKPLLQHTFPSVADVIRSAGS